MLKDEIAVIGAGLAGETVGIEFQSMRMLPLRKMHSMIL